METSRDLLPWNGGGGIVFVNPLSFISIGTIDVADMRKQYVRTMARGGVSGWTLTYCESVEECKEA